MRGLPRGTKICWLGNDGRQQDLPGLFLGAMFLSPRAVATFTWPRCLQRAISMELSIVLPQPSIAGLGTSNAMPMLAPWSEPPKERGIGSAGQPPPADHFWPQQGGRSQHVRRARGRQTRSAEKQAETGRQAAGSGLNPVSFWLRRGHYQRPAKTRREGTAVKAS